jgi:membrane associated rhomboid family serine protease
MRSAAVGFQCPSCVAEGSRSTRSGRATYGGARSGNPALTSQVLIGLNAAVFLFLLVTGGQRSAWFDILALRPRGGPVTLPNGAVVKLPDGVADGAYWQLLTSAFTHTQLLHIGFNMLALWVLGPQLEGVLGRARFLAVYLVSALAGSTLVYWLAFPYGQTIGASGAVFGLMGALLVVVLKMHGPVNQILFWIGLNFVFTVIGRSFISWQGHVGGFAAGMLVAALVVYAPRSRRALWQWLGIGLVTAGLLVAVAVRTVVLGG